VENADFLGIFVGNEKNRVEMSEGRRDEGPIDTKYFAICALDRGLNARITAPKTLLKFANTVVSLTSENACIKT
jgi:hypothetical protein